MPAIIHCDVAIVGGGLAGGLIALALRKKRPELDIRIVESGERLGGNHLWSFFASDVAAADRWLVAPLISYGWTHYDVVFPGHARTLKAGYYAIESDRLDQMVRAALPAHAVMTGRKALGASARAVVLADGDRIEAGGVIDCRGPGNLAQLDLGWQKFLGREFALAEPHPLKRPLIMDATVAQADGYRFVYALPFAATRLFVEDTYYSDTPEIDTPVLRARIDDWLAARRIETEGVTREETGVLPVAMGGDFEEYWRSGGNRVAKAGMRAGLFHPLTGYSLPDAVRLARTIADASDLSGPALHELTYGYARRQWQRRGFYRMLSAMLFRAAEPEERYRILERFYRLDAGLIARFYAGQSSLLDRARVLVGKPPVPVGRALNVVKSVAIRGSQ
ncbi:lycopene beta-cyclase CrtY [Sphingomonas sp. BT-65]|uniref:lycopene beta-cyclase CrtY n=1 Tax=Sphingomonas sp. BT-65 TaxID=2989821 RepID=UPI00223660C7|nr:lycopene beta-cyclase CrtY [Sphingomonas sp. BT-65]MCW4462203.1 lycopene beta-cyclase CrtY [Sphingomonas sp. BT-65]